MTKKALMPKPAAHTSDWLDCDAVRVYAGNTGLAMDHAVHMARAYADKFVWQFPAEQVLFFCDLHADAEAFRRSLIAAKAIACHSKDLLDFDLTATGKAADIVIAGDIFDKGPSNLDVLDLLSHLRSLGAKLTILAGNHDLRIWLTLKALDATDTEQLDYLAEHLERAQLLVSEVLARAVTPTPTALSRKLKAVTKAKKSGAKKSGTKKSSLKKSRSKRAFLQLFGQLEDRSHAGGELTFPGRSAWLAERWQAIEAAYRQRGIEPAELTEGLMIAYDLLVAKSGPYAWLFSEMQLVSRYGSFLLAHGGVDDELCALMTKHGLDRVNRRFRELMARAKPSDLIAGPFGNCTLTKYRPDDEPLTSAGVRKLHGEGIYAIVHGHDNQIGQQNVAYRQELLHFQCDATLNRCTRELQGLTPKGMAVVVFEPQGRLTAYSNDLPEGKSFTPLRSKAATTTGFIHTLLKSFGK